MTYLQKISTGAILSCAALSMVGCQDTWDDHYGQTPDTEYGNASLYEIISHESQLSDFREVLDSARLYANSRITGTHYRDLLDGDQFFTIWAPVNGTFNKDSLLRLCATAEGDSLVERQFLKNHIARFGHSLNGRNEVIRLFNQKDVVFDNSDFNGAKIIKGNVASRNGILHLIEKPSHYYYNIYEALFSLDKYKHVGEYFKSFQIDEFDETQSLAMGVVDGKTVYVDSVFNSYNILTSAYYDHIEREDSTFWMLVPSKEVWDSLYAEAKTYYNFGSINKADSIHHFWSNYALCQDLIYNPHKQRAMYDSLCSTSFNYSEAGRFHVAYKPFEAGGLFSDFADSLKCSNGTIYELKSWPWTKEKSYFKEIKREAEGVIFDNYEASGKQLNLNRYYVSADSVSYGYLYVIPQTITSAYYLTYEVPNVLSGEYDVCVVMLPKTVYDPTTTAKKDFYPNKFVAEVIYTGVDGLEYTVSSDSRYTYHPDEAQVYQETSEESVPYLFHWNAVDDKGDPLPGQFMNNPYAVDTVKLATIKFPTCNYDQRKITTRVKIQNKIAAKEQRYISANMLIDCILFLPHIEKEEN